MSEHTFTQECADARAVWGRADAWRGAPPNLAQRAWSGLLYAVAYGHALSEVEKILLESATLEFSRLQELHLATPMKTNTKSPEPDKNDGIIRTGYKILVTVPGEGVQECDLVYAHKPAAEYAYALAVEEARRSQAAPAVAPRIELMPVDYASLGNQRCLVGRRVHTLVLEERKHLVRAHALKKLTPEELLVLGLEAT